MGDGSWVGSVVWRGNAMAPECFGDAGSGRVASCTSIGPGLSQAGVDEIYLSLLFQL